MQNAVICEPQIYGRPSQFCVRPKNPTQRTAIRNSLTLEVEEENILRRIILMLEH